MPDIRRKSHLPCSFWGHLYAGVSECPRFAISVRIADNDVPRFAVHRLKAFWRDHQLMRGRVLFMLRGAACQQDQTSPADAPLAFFDRPLSSANAAHINLC